MAASCTFGAAGRWGVATAETRRGEPPGFFIPKVQKEPSYARLFERQPPERQPKCPGKFRINHHRVRAGPHQGPLLRTGVYGRETRPWLPGLVAPRVTQAARLARVSEPSVDAALVILRAGRYDLAAGVLDGTFSLLEAAVLAKHPESTLATKFLVSSSADRADLVRAVGPAAIWDRAGRLH